MVGSPMGVSQSCQDGAKMDGDMGKMGGDGSDMYIVTVSIQSLISVCSWVREKNRGLDF